MNSFYTLEHKIFKVLPNIRFYHNNEKPPGATNTERLLHKYHYQTNPIDGIRTYT